MQEPSGFRVFVKGLAPGVTNDDLHRLFSKYGKILHIRSGRSGYAFIDFADERDASVAIRELDGTMLAGFKILVEESHRARGDYHPPQQHQKYSYSRQSYSLSPPLSPHSNPHEQMSSPPPPPPPPPSSSSYYGDNRGDYFVKSNRSIHSYEESRVPTTHYLRDPRDGRNEHEHYPHDREAHESRLSRRSRSPVLHSYRYEPYPERPPTSSSHEQYNRMSSNYGTDLRHRASPSGPMTEPLISSSSSSSYPLRYTREMEDEFAGTKWYASERRSFHDTRATDSTADWTSSNSSSQRFRDEHQSHYHYRHRSPHEYEFRDRERDQRNVTSEKEFGGPSSSSASTSYFHSTHTTDRHHHPHHRDRPPSSPPPPLHPPPSLSRTNEPSHRSYEYEPPMSGSKSLHSPPFSSHGTSDETRYDRPRHRHNDRYSEQHTTSHSPRSRKHRFTHRDENRAKRFKHSARNDRKDIQDKDNNRNQMKIQEEKEPGQRQEQEQEQRQEQGQELRQRQEQEQEQEQVSTNPPQPLPVTRLPYNIYSHTQFYSASLHREPRGRSAEPVPRVLRPSLDVLLPFEIEYNLRPRSHHHEEIHTPDFPPNPLSPQ